MPPRILRRKFGDNTVLEFSSSDYSYKTVFIESEDTRVSMMNLSGNIRDV